jgi:hypothetical protein
VRFGVLEDGSEEGQSTFGDSGKSEKFSNPGNGPILDERHRTPAGPTIRQALGDHYGNSMDFSGPGPITNHKGMFLIGQK